MPIPFALNTKNFIRPLLYALTVFLVLYTAIIFPHPGKSLFYVFISITGAATIIIESLFCVYHLNKHNKRSEKLQNYKFLHHGVNHTLYPLFYFCGFMLYTFYKGNYFLSYSLAVFSFVLYFSHFYLLPFHMLEIHSTSLEKNKLYTRIDFLMSLFKFLSYFVLNLALFEMLMLTRISIETFIIVNFLINSVYLISHLNRKGMMQFSNLLITYLFAFVCTIFIVKAKVSLPNVNAGIATIIFYLTSGIYYQKIEGTYDYKSLVEYASLAVILSVILFSSF